MRRGLLPWQGSLGFGVLIVSLMGPAVAGRAADSARTWTERGREFSAGTLGNSGQNLYVNHRGELGTIHRFDLDGNGYLDLPYNSSHDTWHYIPATLVTAETDGRLVIGNLGVDGSARVISSDLNHDGFTDLVFMPNRQNIQRSRSSLTIAWGAADGWSRARLTRQLPVNGGFGSVAGLKPALYGDDAMAVGDLDGDGWEDIITLNTLAWLPGQPPGRILRIYWGGAGGFLLSHHQDLGIAGAVEVVAGRFGSDRAFTAAIATDTGELHYLLPVAGEKAVRIGLTVKLPLTAPAAVSRMVVQPGAEGRPDSLWAATSAAVLLHIGASGRPDEVQSIPAPPATSLAIGRLDDDAWPDLVLTSLKLYYPTDPLPDPIPASVTVLWGTSGGVDAAHPARLAVLNAISAAVGDVNGDGKADLMVAVHQGKLTTEANSLIYLGDGSRHLPAAGRPVPTTGAQGSAVVRLTPDSKPVAIFNNCVKGTLDSAVPVRLFWGAATGFSADAKVDIPNVGGYQSTAADINADGYADLVVINGGEVSSENSARAEQSGAFIYWGGPEGAIRGPGPTRFDVGRSQVLREKRLGAVNVADLNKDGYLDVLTGALQEPGLAIHYGSADGLKPENRQVLAMAGGRQVACLVVDANRDGWLDIVVTSYETDKFLTYWGGPQGFSTSRVTVIDYPRPIDAEAADLNGDGWLDLLVTSYIDNVSDHSDTGLSIFWGGPGGWKPANSQWLPGSTPVGFAVADLDGDGFLDIVCPAYHGELTREELPAYIYWGSAEGYATRQRTSLIVNSGHDAVLADFDRDGKLDIAFSAHSTDPGHDLSTPIFFNDGQRFKSPRVQWLPVIGPHYMWEHDIGNIATRRHEEEFTSHPLAWTEARSTGRVDVEATATFGARVVVTVRSAASDAALANAPWRAAASGTFDVAPTERVLQYHLALQSANGDAYPTVRQVTVKLN